MDQSEKNLLAICERIEDLARQAYRKLAQVHAADGELAALWSKTSVEEENHALQFRMSPMMMDSMVGQLSVTIADGISATRRLLAFLQRCDASPPGPIEALREMIDFEQSLARFHMENAAVFNRVEHRKLFHAMMNADRDHVGALQAALERRTRKA